MKRIFALLLAAVMLLTACAPQDERPKYPAAEDAPQSESPKPQEEPAAQRAPESVQTLAAPKLPDIPAAPDWAEYDARISALNEENISEEERMEREAAVWEEYSAADAAHWDAVRALRGDAQWCKRCKLLYSSRFLLQRNRKEKGRASPGCRS